MRSGVGDTGREEHQLLHLAAVERQIDDLTLGYDLADGGRLRGYERCIAGDLHLLRERADIQRDGLRGCLADCELDATLHVACKAGLLNRHFVCTDGQTGEEVVTCGPGADALSEPGIRVLHRHLGIRNGGAGLVGYIAA